MQFLKKMQKRNTHKFEFLECWEVSKHSVYCTFPSSISWRQVGSPAHIKSLLQAGFDMVSIQHLLQ